MACSSVSVVRAPKAHGNGHITTHTVTLLFAILLAAAACGDETEPSTTSAPPDTTSIISTTTAATTTSPPVTITPPPRVGNWRAVLMDQVVSPSCCDMPVIAPASPDGPLPLDGWPADGFYSVTAVRAAEPGDTINLEIFRWASCADFPDRCSPDPPQDGMTPDPTEFITRTVVLDASVTVVVWPLWTFFDDGPTALVGTGLDFAALLVNGIDAAYRQWVVTPFAAGLSIEELNADLTLRSDDPVFPFGRDAVGWEGFVYRAPSEARLAASPGSLLEQPEPWPPGSNGLYDWWVTLEIRNGAPVLYVYANQIAG